MSKSHQTHIISSGNDPWTILRMGQQNRKLYLFENLVYFYLKPSKTNHLRCVGAPGVLKSDLACIVHAHW